MHVEAFEIETAAAQIVVDSSDDLGLRVTSAYWLSRSAEDSTLLQLASYVLAVKPESREEKEVVAILISALLERRIWSASQAYSVLPLPDRRVVDSTHLLPSRIIEHLNPADAEAILASHSPAGLHQIQKEWEQSGGPEIEDLDPRLEIWLAALKAVSIAEPLNEEALVLAGRLLAEIEDTFSPDLLYERGVREPILEAQRGVQRSPTARRELFLGGVSKAEGHRRGHLISPEGLLWAEDLGWLWTASEKGVIPTPEAQTGSSIPCLQRPDEPGRQKASAEHSATDRPRVAGERRSRTA